MFTKLSDTTKAAVFSVLLLLLGVGAASLINALGLTTGFAMFGVWMTTPAVATLLMLLVVTRDGYSKEGWKSLGLHRLGLGVWWIAFGVVLLITVAATAIVWTTPLASFVVPEYGMVGVIADFFFVLVVFTPTFILAEEVGIRGYLLPKLLPLGMGRALLLSGLVWAAWHLILFYLTPLFPTGERAGLRAPRRGNDRRRELPLRLLQALHGQRVAGRHRTRGAQQPRGHPGGAHRDVLAGAGEPLPGRGQRDTDRGDHRARGRVGGPHP